jgi:arylsulfatase A-like enzyme
LSVRHLAAASLALAMLAVTLSSTGCGSDGERPPPAATRTYDAEGRALHPIASGRARPNVVVLLIDTLRADAVTPTPTEGTPEAGTVMPYLSGLAGRSVCFTQASSPAPWTLPSVLSMFTGMLPRDHGLTTEDLVGAPHVAHLATWAEVMRSSLGYQTCGLFGSYSAGMSTALDDGFDTAREGFDLQRIDAELDAWTAERDPARPFFLYLHSFEAHDPYGAASHPPVGPTAAQFAQQEVAALASLEALGSEPSIAELLLRSTTDGVQRVVLRRHPRYRPLQTDLVRYMWSGLATDPGPSIAPRLEAAYRAGLTWVDGLIAQAVASLERRGLLENTLLIVTGDHGEAFGEHGMLLHGRQVYDELLRVPLVLRGPPPFDRAQRIGGSVGLTDIFPSVLAWLGAPPPDDIEGRSFLPLLAADGPGRPVEAQEVRTQMHTAGLSAAVLGSVRSSAWKYIGTYDILAGTLSEEAYDLRADAEERRNLAGPDGLVRDLPFDEPFCMAVERTRDRLWASAAQGAGRELAGSGVGAAMKVADRPASDCPPKR